MTKPLQKPRKLPKQERSQATVSSILIAATRILTEEGYDKFNTNRVAELAGVSVGSLYQYFPNKAALLYALGEHHANEMERLAQHHLEDLGDRSILEVLQQIIKAVLAAYAVNPKLYRILHQQVPRSEEMQKLDDARIEQMLHAFLALHRDQLRPQNLDITVFIISRTIKALLYDAIADRPNLLKNGELEQELMRMLSSYLMSPNSL
ncbi:TetR/AcrR family transcriptional regulator [Pseudanabaena sp. UWO311]|uniref:TetR/AcrR family transcriptional regulator n=1 Tax=Pseudanabaena sp. UWO311 TaxID=2487337 RepID=UPI0011596BB2|nr:TetR/AcrR family transcriptional regulator [Pseudanabaena sp. UWO311]TYQ28905.1 TetR/AcrR family transcriptional regulator [Pseudanabaena sp. UWO311]